MRTPYVYPRAFIYVCRILEIGWKPLIGILYVYFGSSSTKKNAFHSELHRQAAAKKKQILWKGVTCDMRLHYYYDYKQDSVQTPPETNRLRTRHFHQIWVRIPCSGSSLAFFWLISLERLCVCVRLQFSDGNVKSQLSPHVFSDFFYFHWRRMCQNTRRLTFTVCFYLFTKTKNREKKNANEMC